MTGLLFLLSGYFLIDPSLVFMGSYVEISKLIILLGAAFVTVVFVFYDIRFMEIPDEVLLPFIIILLVFLSVDTYYTLDIFSYFRSFDTPLVLSPLLDGLL